MMRSFPLLLLMIALAACAPQGSPSAAPTVIPFPTTTPGRAISGGLPTVVALPLDGSMRANPATAVALSLRPTATPDYSDCPPQAAPALPPAPPGIREMADAINAYLSAGGTAAGLQTALRDQWNALGESGLVRADLDLTGEGTPDILVIVAAPEGGGALLILGCVGGRYMTHFQFINPDAVPQVIHVGDMNVSGQREVLYTGRQCDFAEDEAEDCPYVTRLITWSPGQGRYISLLSRPITSPEPPFVSDVDNDRVLEIIVRLTSTGTAATGPLRTGVHIYDWNGESYLLSISQLDPPRFRIQVIHQADRMVERRDMRAAVDLYLLALNDPGLRNWFNDDPAIHNAYILYRLLTVYAFTEDERLISIYQATLSNYPDLEQAPVYAAMSSAFWDRLQQTNNLRSACDAVRAIINARPEALAQLNRYGSRSPTYTASDLCPF
jgi:hypothetical protein